MNIAEQKAILRTKAQELIAEAARADPAAGRKLLGQFIKLNMDDARRWPKRSIVAVYYPQDDELDISPVISWLMEIDFILCLPRTHEDNTLTFHSWTPRAPMKRGRFGILEPVAEAREYIPNIIIKTCRMVNRNGRWLGRGKGCYDRTIGELEKTHAGLRVIVCAYDCQVAPVPFDQFDGVADMIITPSRIIKTKPALTPQTSTCTSLRP